MADLKVALEDLALESSGTAQTQVPARSFSFSRRLAVAALAPVLVAVAYFATQSWRESPASEPMQALPLTSLSGVVRFPSLSPDGNHVVFSWTGAKQDNQDIYVQQIGAGAPLRLTSDPNNDYSPNWSPDGRMIAFLRRGPAGNKSEVRLIAPLGGTERKVADIEPRGALYRPISLAWCPDSACVLTIDSAADGKPDAVFTISINTHEKRQLTYPQGRVVDADPTISPDGRSLLFRRDATPFSGEFYRQSLKGQTIPDGEPVRLTSTLSAGKPAWIPGSREFAFAARGALWRLDAFGGGVPARLPFVGQDGTAPVVSRTPSGRQRLVYVRSFADGNVWRVDTSAAGAPAPSSPVVAIASTRNEAIPNLSPSEVQMAFLSNRSGESEIWVAAPDGSNAVQLTSMGVTPGFPRWSPDGKLIAFHGDPDARPDLIVVPSGGGQPKILTKNTTGGAFPSFSRDGQSIYFQANNGTQRIWKMPALGGTAVQLTNNIGGLAIESQDGRDLYYVETVERSSSLWRLPLAGGAAVKVLDGVALGNFDVVERGIYFIERVAGEAGIFFSDRPAGETRLQYFDFSTRRLTTVAHNLGTVGFGLSASRDGRTIFYSRIDSSVDELMLVDNFR
jgi:Tol biopolymer transport system component